MAYRFVVDVLVLMIPLMLLSSSVWPVSRCLNIVRLVIAVMALMIMYNILCIFSIAQHLSPAVYRWCSAGATIIYVTLFVLGIWYRVREVKAVMQAGTVWANLSFMVDALYEAFVVVEVVILMSAAEKLQIVTYAVCVMLNAAAAAYGIRIASDSLFVFYRRHERRIVESMKLAPVEVAGIGSRENDVFKDIYERVVEYFEREKPFLNGDLTINEVVSVVFTNKLYISRAISQYTGRNFCQFVNYYRIVHSLELFRQNPSMKISDLALQSGFNSAVSFGMAFNLFMGQKPGDWCRRERYRLEKLKK
jgi:AraC-like DNA-binding protein